ncbi:MAG TPA: OmpA family protein [Ignavibacteriaceae bacterium]|nr:OmpA family protein [Ignavibacteriaceae bacterium]
MNGGGSDSTEKWRNPVDGKDPAAKYAPAKRSRREKERLDDHSEIFAEDGEKDRYLITYADLITLLLGLFILLYAASNVDIKKYQNMMSAVGSIFGGDMSGMKIGQLQGQGVSDPLEVLVGDVQNLIAKNGMENSIKIIENERGLTVRILDNILFATGRAELSEYSRIILQNLAVILKKIPNDIRIEGHTDNVPISTAVFPSNWHLSVARATTTAYYLMVNEGLPPDRVSVVGYAEYKPVDTNETPAGRANNRRVDIVILK